MADKFDELIENFKMTIMDFIDMPLVLDETFPEVVSARAALRAEYDQVLGSYNDNLPTEPGYYWARDKESGEETVIALAEYDRKFYVNGSEEPFTAEDFRGWEFSGPLRPPSKG